MDIAYDKTNVSAYKYQENVHDHIVDICSPLREYFGIKLFAYYKIFPDGKYFFTSTNLDLSRFILDIVTQKNCTFWEGAVLLDHLNGPGNTTPLIGPTFPKCPMDQGTYDLGFWNWVDFVRISSGTIEAWWLAGDTEASNLQSFCMKNYRSFLEFTKLFNTSAAHIIDCEENTKQKVGFHQLKPPEILQTHHESEIIESFLKDIRKKSKYLHKIKPELTYLTSREQECLSYLAKGDTAKEIARNLEISYRTVETHLKTIKCKTGFHSRSQLVKFFLNHFS